MPSHWRRKGVLAIAVAAMTLGVVLPAGAGPGSSPAPAFALEGLNGKPVSLAAYKGSPVILLFWAPW